MRGCQCFHVWTLTSAKCTSRMGPKYIRNIPRPLGVSRSTGFSATFPFWPLYFTHTFSTHTLSLTMRLFNHIMDSRLNKRDSQLNQALAAYNSGTYVSIRKCDSDFGVPRSTMQNHIQKPTTAAIGQEQHQRLSFRQEKWLVD
jgi:hypothetical protein